MDRQTVETAAAQEQHLAVAQAPADSLAAHPLEAAEMEYHPLEVHTDLEIVAGVSSAAELGVATAADIVPEAQPGLMAEHILVAATATPAVTAPAYPELLVG